MMKTNCPQCTDKLCPKCEKEKAKREQAKQRRRARDEAMRSLGMTKVRGASGRTYWE